MSKELLKSKDYMKRLLTIILVVLFFNANAQNPRTLDINQSRNESMPGEILIKLKDEVDPGINIRNSAIQSYDSIGILERIGLKDKVFSSKILFSIKTRKYKTPRYNTGTVSKEKYNLNNLMKVKLKEEYFRDKDKIIDYVLGKPTKEDRDTIYECIDVIINEIDNFFRGESTKLMNKMNGENRKDGI